MCPPVLAAELTHVLAVVDPPPPFILGDAYDAWQHHGMDLELLELAFDSDLMVSLDAGRSMRLLAFTGSLTFFSVHVRNDEHPARLTGFVEDADGMELGESGPNTTPGVLTTLRDHRFESWVTRRGPVRFWLRAPGRGWRSVTDWLLLPG